VIKENFGDKRKSPLETGMVLLGWWALFPGHLLRTGSKSDQSPHFISEPFSYDPK